MELFCCVWQQMKHLIKMNRLFSFPQHDSGRDTLRSRKRTCLLTCLVCGALLFSILLWAEDSKAEDKEQGSLAEVGAKLSNPVSEVWALFTEFDVFFSDGDLNRAIRKSAAGCSSSLSCRSPSTE